jgi:hypothetical protein
MRELLSQVHAQRRATKPARAWTFRTVAVNDFSAVASSIILSGRH